MLNRRDFLKHGAGTAAFVAASPIVNGARRLFEPRPKPIVNLSVCIDMILTEIPFLDRIDRIKRLGFSAFEFWDWKSKDVDAIVKKKNELGLEIATIMGSGW